MITVKEIETKNSTKTLFYEDDILIAIEEYGIITEIRELTDEERTTILEMI